MGPTCAASLATWPRYEWAHDFEISISNSWSVDPHSPRCGSACGRRRKPGEGVTTCRALVRCVPRSFALSTRGNFGRPTIRSNWGAAGVQCRAAGVLLDGAASKNAQHVPYTPGGKRPGCVYSEGWSTAMMSAVSGHWAITSITPTLPSGGGTLVDDGQAASIGRSASRQLHWYAARGTGRDHWELDPS